MSSPRTDAATRVIVRPENLGAGGMVDTPAAHAAALLRQQYVSWPLLRQGYDGLSAVQVRSFAFEGFELKVQFNPGRITSSTAKVDPQSIKERKCFLCLQHLPREQRGVAFGQNFVILCNPFPIFPEHFTIPHRDHVPQRIAGSFGVLLDLARGMGSRYTTFYNGPRCGASAPDHLHFQAWLKGFMPIDTEFPEVARRCGRVLFERRDLRITAIEGHLRRLIALEGSSREALWDAFTVLLQHLARVTGESEEPMINIIVSHEEGWRVLVFPRAQHRPSFFFAEGEAQMLISPAAVDLGGVCITPLENDFQRVRREDLELMFEEITLGKTAFDEVAEFRNYL